MNRIVRSNTWSLCLRNFTSAHQRALSKYVTVFHNRFAHTFHNDQVAHSLEARENLQLEDVNLVENSNNEFKKPSKSGVMKGEAERFSTAAVKTGKSPHSPGTNKGGGPQHD